MKKVNIIFVLLAMIALMISSCKKDETKVDDADKFVGTYIPTNSNGINLTITKLTATTIQVLWIQEGIELKYSANVSGSTITILQQDMGGGDKIYGSGNLTGNTLTLTETYLITGQSPDTSTRTYTKQ